jgi:hypothetical protein
MGYWERVIEEDTRVKAFEAQLRSMARWPFGGRDVIIETSDDGVEDGEPQQAAMVTSRRTLATFDRAIDALPTGGRIRAVMVDSRGRTRRETPWATKY